MLISQSRQLKIPQNSGENSGSGEEYWWYRVNEMETSLFEIERLDRRHLQSDSNCHHHKIHVSFQHYFTRKCTRVECFAILNNLHHFFANKTGKNWWTRILVGEIMIVKCCGRENYVQKWDRSYALFFVHCSHCPSRRWGNERGREWRVAHLPRIHFGSNWVSSSTTLTGVLFFVSSSVRRSAFFVTLSIDCCSLNCFESETDRNRAISANPNNRMFCN